MIEINLLPEELRKKKIKFIKPDKAFFIIASGIVGVSVVLILAINLIIGLNFRAIKSLKGNLESLKKDSKEAELMSQELASFRQKMAVIDGLVKRKFLWAKKLNELSSLISSGIWLTELNFNPQDSMRISGSVVSRRGEEMAFVAKFMKNLKEDRSFFSDFKEIELEGIQRRSVKGIEVVDFTLIIK